MLPTGSQERKNVPLWAGCINYFADALAAVAELSKKGNDKHNPGEPLHWSREKSNDHPDCVARHLADIGKDWTAVDPEDNVLHAVKVAWRALALAQIAVERQRAKRDAATPAAGGGYFEKPRGVDTGLRKWQPWPPYAPVPASTPTPPGHCFTCGGRCKWLGWAPK